MIFISENDKLSMLANAVKGREAEVMNYQVNIDNYKLAISNIQSKYSATDAECAAGPLSGDTLEDCKRINAVIFAYQLETLLIENELECDKAKMMLDVLMSQLDGIDIKSFVVEEPLQ